MRIALDYDNTYTRDPPLWDRFVASVGEAGHEIVCVTMRYPEEPVTMPCQIVYTSRKAKGDFLRSKGVSIDIWIDDSPHWIFVDG